MVIKKFIGRGLHGYINVDVNFFSGLTFLYGINGSGKTSVVRCIHALLSPSFAVLSEIEHSRIEVHIEIDGATKIIKSITSENCIVLSISSERDVLSVPAFGQDMDVPVWRQDEARNDWEMTFRSTCLTHPVYQAIDALPSPMYLGLERRAGASPRRLIRTGPRGGQAVGSSSSLLMGLNDASGFAGAAFRDAYAEESKLKDELRNDLILALFSFEDMSRRRSITSRDIPSRISALKILDGGDAIKDALSSIGFEQRQINDTVGAFLSELRNLIQNLPDPRRKKSPTDLDMPEMASLIRFEFNKAQFTRIAQIAQRIEKFSLARSQIYNSIERYQRLINDFLRASNKTISVGLSGLAVEIGDIGNRPITALSSGEQQLIVLLTQLWFNPNTAASNVLIIDEPELSLHIAWQEQFVDALIEAHSGIQLILATHSPSIIADRVDNSIELVPNYA